jgi:hypothetical protein
MNKKMVRRSIVIAAAVLGVSAAVPPALLLAAPNDDAPSSLVEDYSYPGAAQIQADDPLVQLISGDGHIVYNKTCATPATGVGRIAVETTAGGDEIVCFDVLGPKGELKLKIDAVFSIDGRKAEAAGGASASATIQPEGGTATTVTLDKSFNTPVGQGADPNGAPATLLELSVSPS